MKEEIENLRTKCAQTGKAFIYNPDEERDEEQQIAYFYFIGKHKGKEVIYDAFMMTLHYDYEMQVMDEAEDKFLERYPELEEKEYAAYTDDLQDEYDQLVEEIKESNLVRVQESIDFFDDDKPHLRAIEVSLNVKKINDNVLEDFIKKLNADVLELDDRLYPSDIR